MSRALLPAMAVLALAACSEDLVYEGAFVLPSAADITAPGQPTPFSETVAYVASRTGGQIRGLGAESGRFLSDDASASFLRGSPLATGQRRALMSVAIWSPTPEQLTVFAVDEAFDVLVEVPHIIGVEDGVPVEPVVSVSEVAASGGGGISELDVHDGFAATETWTLTWDGAAWRAEGTRSGQLDGRIDPGVPYTPRSQAFTLTTTAGTEAGDTLTFTTDSGLIEHPLGAAPIAVSTAPGQDLLAVILQDEGSDTGEVIWWDPASASIAGQVDLPEGRRPTALTWAGDTLWIADGATQVGPDGDGTGAALWSVASGGTEARRVDIPTPASSLTAATGAGRLYYVPVGSFDLHAINLDTGAAIDLDPVRPGQTGFPFHGVIRGITELPGSFQQFDDDDDLSFRTATDVIAVSLFRGTVLFYDPATGCLLQDGLGPRTLPTGRTTNGVSAGDYQFDFDGETNGAELVSNEANANHVVVNACAGIARSESWRLTFDDVELGWEVEGELSGVQSRLAYEGTRYISDDGAVSFLIEPGTTPSRGGWTMQFTVTEGSLGITGDQDEDGLVDQRNNEFNWTSPGAPLPVVLPAAGSRSEPVPAVIVPIEGQDLVARGRPETGLTDAVWQ